MSMVLDDFQKSIQKQIVESLGVCPRFDRGEDVSRECERRIGFLKHILVQSGCCAFVLGVSGGVDSLCAALMAQRAVALLRVSGELPTARFIAMRLPFDVQADESDCQHCLEVIKPDEVVTTNIGTSVRGLQSELAILDETGASTKDFLLGNVKSRIRMVAQYAVAGVRKGLVIGTDHAAEAVMGFFTKYGDGGADVMPLSGLTKCQVRALAREMGAPEDLVMKTPIADLEELRPGLPDEEAHGVKYAMIDAFLQLKDVANEDFEKICRAYANSSHKRCLPSRP